MQKLKQFIYSNKKIYRFLKGIKYCFAYGPKTAIKIAKRTSTKKIDASHSISAYERHLQQKHKFSKNIKFSIIIYALEESEKAIINTIKSIINQTYQNYEILIATKTENNSIQKNLFENIFFTKSINEAIELSSGDYLIKINSNDSLHPCALYEIMNKICSENSDFIYTDEAIYTQENEYKFKPNFASDTLRSYNYIGSFFAFSRKLLNIENLFSQNIMYAFDYDMILSLTEQASNITHIPKILNFTHPENLSENYDEEAKTVLAHHLERTGLDGKVEISDIEHTFKINYTLKIEPLVSIIIPNKDHIGDLKKCIDSILKSTYKNYEIIIVENNSQNSETFEYYKSIKKQNIKIITWEKDFNYSAINNFGIKSAKGDYYILLNNDIEIITPDWIQKMLMFAQRDNVGAVGSKLLYPDNTIQHAGVILSILGIAVHYRKGASENDEDIRLNTVQNLSAVTAACMMIPKHVYDETGGLNEEFKVAFNDIDLCMRIRKSGYLIVFNPYCKAYHYESKSRGLETTSDKKKRFKKEMKIFRKYWSDQLKSEDPYYNPNLTLSQ